MGKRNHVSSRFSIMTADMPSVMTGMAVVVGQVLQGFEILSDVQVLPIKQDGGKYVPSTKVTITDCGQL